MPLINGQSFPDYVHQEYPKWITLPDGKQQIVESAHEEEQLLGAKEVVKEPEFVGFKGFEFKIDPLPVIEPVEAEIAPIAEETPEPVIAPDGEVIADDIDALRAQADALGLIYDKRWGVLKLRQVIDNARAKAATGE